MGGLLHLVQQKGSGRGRPAYTLLAVPNITAHPSMASVPIIVLLNGPLLCGFNVPIKGLNNIRPNHYPVSNFSISLKSENILSQLISGQIILCGIYLLTAWRIKYANRKLLRRPTTSVKCFIIIINMLVVRLISHYVYVCHVACRRWATCQRYTRTCSAKDKIDTMPGTQTRDRVIQPQWGHAPCLTPS